MKKKCLNSDYSNTYIPQLCVAFLLVALWGGLAVGAQTTGLDVITPGWNLFANEHDIQLGKEQSAQFEKEIVLVQDQEINDYIVGLGERLIKNAPESGFQFSFKLIADPGFHAFAFPGGPVYLTSGMLVAAENEAQFAGLIAHQIAHITLRHSTSMASRKAIFRVRAALVASSTGKTTLLEALRAIGLSTGPGSELYSYDTVFEQDANVLATRMMAAAGYDPFELYRFFSNLQNESHAGLFLERHPVNQARKIQSPIDVQVALRPPLANIRKFEAIRQRAGESKLDALVRREPPQELAARSFGPKEKFITATYEFVYPASWKPGKPGPNGRFQVAPKGGLVRPAGGTSALVLGIISGTFQVADLSSSGTAAPLLLQRLKEIRSGLTTVANQTAIKPSENTLESVFLEGLSPVSGEKEFVWAVTSRLPGGIFYLLMIAPESMFQEQKMIFEEVFASIRIRYNLKPGLFGRM